MSTSSMNQAERRLRGEVGVDLVVALADPLGLFVDDPVHPLAIGHVRADGVDGDVVASCSTERERLLTVSPRIAHFEEE